jgi:hypothetical protein
MSKETCHLEMTLDTPNVKRDLNISKETYHIEMGPLLTRHMSKEIYVCQRRPKYVERDLHMSKETYHVEMELSLTIYFGQHSDRSQRALNIRPAPCKRRITVGPYECDTPPRPT